MSSATEPVTIRTAQPGDLVRLTEIYNYYIVNTPITFDLDAVTVEDRRPWLAQFAENGPHRLLVAEDVGVIVGYAGSHSSGVTAPPITITTSAAPRAVWTRVKPCIRNYRTR